MILSIDPFLARTRIACFTMEMAIRPEMHTGGLGVLAGWWLEACIDGVTGWAIGRDGGGGGDHDVRLYEKLERTVLPLYHRDRGRWIGMMKQSIAKVAARFNT